MPVPFENLSSFIASALRFVPDEEETLSFCLSSIQLQDREISIEEGVNLILDTLPTFNMEEVLRLRFGLTGDAQRMPQRKVALRFGKSLPWVQDQEMRTLRKIRQHPFRRGWLVKFMRYSVSSRRVYKDTTYEEILDLKALAHAVRLMNEEQNAKLPASIFSFIEYVEVPLSELARVLASGNKVVRVGSNTQSVAEQVVHTAQELRATY